MATLAASHMIPKDDLAGLAGCHCKRVAGELLVHFATLPPPSPFSHVSTCLLDTASDSHVQNPTLIPFISSSFFKFPFFPYSPNKLLLT